MTSTTQTLPPTDFPDRAAALTPLLREHALWGDENRRLHDDVLAALGRAGVFRMRVPARYGGAEADASTMLRTLEQVGRGDGSAAWVAAVWSTCAWLAGLFPDHVQDEVFSSPDVLVCGVLSPTATAVPRDGGIVVDGRWQFISGALHSGWQLVLAMAPTPDGSAQWPVMALVPLSDLEVVDDWHTAGLRGTGSVTTVARGVFVPGDRVLPMVAILEGQYASVLNAASPIYRAPMIATGCVAFAGSAVGLAKAAREAFLDRLPGRRITYTEYPSQREAPLTHLQLAEATLKADEAGFHATRLAATVDEKSATGEPWTVLDRVAARAALGRVLGLVKESVDILATASGGTSVYSDVPIQRISRDIQTLNLHALMHPNTNLELYGRVLCGLEPNSMYI
ncbi:acyl-CoA dehydrogenase family protein [Saccharothrix variisporea]|uniref:Alkylation response protein AidB-like acyl-CoA dehydrogenase n=1 Tax=Saccharothrix variisporea TaxID=543527 RepID=A0A495X4L8_9PSEU|nr:acyl-CoA dehydrogenase family protein [Saccharothrix variisporea]RKT69231.1 alkylation response protein AidB-like acyl-CoA dehydrogenase [Saccharothrix variisporea]